MGATVRSGQRLMRWRVGAACVVFAVMLAGGCQNYNIPITPTGGGTSTGGSTGVTVTLNPPGAAFVDSGLTLQIVATLQGDTNNQGVTWTLTGPGTLSSITTTSVTYNAPTTTGTPATLTATSVADITQIATETLFIVPLPTIPALALPNGTVGVPYSSSVTGQNGSVPYNWSISAGNLPPGVTPTVASENTISFVGVPTTTGTFSFTLQLIDASGAKTSQMGSIIVAPSTSPALRSMLATLGGGGVNDSQVQGSYAFRFGGFGPNGMTVSAGSFTTDGNGNIASGVLDRSSARGAQTGMAFTGTYAVGANNLGTMTLNLADGERVIYALAVSSSGNARFIEFDDDQSVVNAAPGTNGSGEMKRQDVKSLGTASGAGNYAFELTGVDAQGARLAIAGEFVTANSGVMSQGTLDTNDNGNVTTQIGFVGNRAVAASGIGNATLNIPGFGVVHVNLYGISADEAFAVGIDGTGQPVLTGSVLRQNGAPFSNASFSGNMDMQTTGFANGETQMTFGLMSADGKGAATVTAAQMAGDGASAMDATYAANVSATGRAALGATGQAPIVYLVSANEGFVMGTDAAVTSGWIQPHAAGTMTTASFDAALAGASLVPGSSGVTESVISLSFDGNGNVTGIGASSGPQGLSLLPAQQGTYSVGEGDIFLGVTWGTQSPQPMLIVSPAKLVVVPSGANFTPIVVDK